MIGDEIFLKHMVNAHFGDRLRRCKRRWIYKNTAQKRAPQRPSHSLFTSSDRNLPLL